MRTLGLFALLSAAAALSANDPTKPAELALNQGLAAAARKEYAKAEVSLASAAVLAQAGKLEKIEKDATEARVKNLEAWASSDEAKGGAQQFACNNLGVIYLRQGDVPQALKAFGRVPEPKGGDASAYFANHALAWDRAGDPKKAAALYARSLANDPRNGLAAAAAANLLVAPNERFSAADRAAAAGQLLNTSRLAPLTSRSVVHTLLKAWKDDANARVVLPHVLHYLAELPADAAWFAANEKPALAAFGDGKATAGAVKELLRLYAEEGFAANDTDLHRIDPFRRLPAWGEVVASQQARRDLGRVLKLAADGFARRAAAAKGEGRETALEAVRRYAAAASEQLDPEDAAGRAAAYTGVVRTLTDRRDDIGKQVSDRMLSEYMDELFRLKNQLYDLRDFGLADLRSLGVLHQTLGAILEARPEWERGPYQLAVFQFGRALWVEQVLRRPAGTPAPRARDGGRDMWNPPTDAPTDPDYPVSPGLRVRLADALRRAKSPAEAVSLYVQAADLYLTLGQPRETEAVAAKVGKLRAAGSLPPSPKDDPLVQFEILARTSPREPLSETRTATAPPAIAFSKSDTVAFGDGNYVAGWQLTSDDVVPGKPLHGKVFTAQLKSSKLLSSVSGAATADVWLGSAAEPKSKRLANHKGDIHAVTVASAGDLVASIGGDGLKVYNFQGEMSLTRGGSAGEFKGTALTPDGGRVVVAGAAGLELLSVAKNETIWKRATDKPAVAVALSADGRFAAAGLSDGHVVVCDAATGEVRRTFFAHPGAVTTAVFHPRAARLATAGPDQAVKVWDAESGREVARYGGPGRPTAVAFSQAGDALVIATEEFGGGAIRAWATTAPTK